MAITIDAQVEVDGTPIANGTYRHIVGPVACAVSTGGTKVLSCEFILEGSTPEELATRWATTKSELNKRDPRVVMWIDRANQSTPTEDMRSGDSEHGPVTTRISFEPMRTQTGYAYACVFLASTTLLTPQSVANGSPRIPFVGQDGEIDVVKIYNSGAKISRMVRARFTSTINKSGYGPFTLGSTVNVGGKARFTLVGALPAFVDGMTIIFSGTTNYNGPHRVISISGQNVLTDSTWLANDVAGSCYLSQVTTGQQNYDSARTTLLADFLKVAQYGAYLAAEELAMTGESIRQLDKDGYTIEVMLSAGHMPAQLSSLPSAREFAYSCKRAKRMRSLESGETPPVTYEVEGQYVVDADQLGSATLQSTWNTVRSNIISSVQAQLGETVKIATVETSLDPSSMRVSFFMALVSSTATVVDFTYSEVWAFKLNYRAWKIKNGKHHVQVEPGPQECTVSVTATRRGYNSVNMAAVVPTPGQAGFIFLPAGSADARGDREEMDDGSELHSQTFSVIYVRFNTSANEVIPFQPAVKP
jgi:hypothetical protein